MSDLGYTELAYTITTQETYPGWFDMVFNHGNSVFKENWEGGLVQMPSLAGSIGWWFYYSLAGIQPSKRLAGFKEFTINPLFDRRLTHAKGEYQSLYGKIISDWKIEGDSYFLSVEVPENTSAYIHLPTADINKIYESGKPVKGNKIFCKFKTMNGKTLFSVGSGKY